MIKGIYFRATKFIIRMVYMGFWGFVLMLLMAGCVSIAVNTTAQPLMKAPSSQVGVRVFSWNVSADAFVRDPKAFGGFVKQSCANLVLLDEVAPFTTETQIRSAIEGVSLNHEDEWYIDFGQSGGRQRDVIVSRLPLESLPEFSKIIPYPEYSKDRLRKLMIEAGDLKYVESLDDGIAVNGVLITDSDHRLLVVSMDLECCGNDPNSWEEYKRRVETRQIRSLIRRVLERTHVDGIIVAGDFNLVSTGIPLVNISGPYVPPHAGLIAAELYHRDGIAMWTWDGRGTPFPSRAMDFVLYSPNTLKLKEGYILNTEDFSVKELEEIKVQPETSSKVSEHLPLVAEFVWQ